MLIFRTSSLVFHHHSTHTKVDIYFFLLLFIWTVIKMLLLYWESNCWWWSFNVVRGSRNLGQFKKPARFSFQDAISWLSVKSQLFWQMSHKDYTIWSEWIGKLNSHHLKTINKERNFWFWKWHFLIEGQTFSWNSICVSVTLCNF